MSHEIRTPMNAISGMIDIILRESKEQETREYALSIKRACDSLLSIINDVLDISKIESGKLEIINSEYKLSEVLEDVLTIANNRLEDKNLMFVTNFNAELPDHIYGDEVRVKQVMVNILNNAIKFTQEGHIAFDVDGEVVGDKLRLKFTVTDTGHGISEEDKSKLFANFERINTTKNRNIEGTGLGLAISKRLCEMMDGTIEVESEVGKGSSFCVTITQDYKEGATVASIDCVKSVLIFESRELYSQSVATACRQLKLAPVVCCSLQSEINDALNDNDFDYIFTSSMYHYKVQEMLIKKDVKTKIVLLSDSSEIKSKHDYTTILMPANSLSVANMINGKSLFDENGVNFKYFTAPDCKLLIVDDNLVNLKVAEGLLKPYKFTIDTAENGEQAVEKIKENRYDLVFMDHMMPVMDGIDATIAVRAMKGDYFQNIPIIALTANAIVGTREIFIKEGMNDFVAKPIKIAALNEVLTKWLPKEKQLTGETPPPEQEVQQTTDIKIAGIDTALGLSRIGGDFESYINILNMYYKDGIKRMPTLHEYFDNQQYNEYRVEVHALKSASASIGALEVSDKARMLEDACIKEDWQYLHQHSTNFCEKFNELVENIREALKEHITEQEQEGKPTGEQAFLTESLTSLKEALDNVDINECDQLLDQLLTYSWDEKIHTNILTIKDFVAVYEYDEAIEFIEKLES